MPVAWSGSRTTCTAWKWREQREWSLEMQVCYWISVHLTYYMKFVAADIPAVEKYQILNSAGCNSVETRQSWASPTLWPDPGLRSGINIYTQTYHCFRAGTGRLKTEKENSLNRLNVPGGKCMGCPAKKLHTTPPDWRWKSTTRSENTLFVSVGVIDHTPSHLNWAYHQINETSGTCPERPS